MHYTAFNHYYTSLMHINIITSKLDEFQYWKAKVLTTPPPKWVSVQTFYMYIQSVHNRLTSKTKLDEVFQSWIMMRNASASNNGRFIFASNIGRQNSSTFEWYLILVAIGNHMHLDDLYTGTTNISLLEWDHTWWWERVWGMMGRMVKEWQWEEGREGTRYVGAV